MEAAILGMGLAVPPAVVTRAEGESIARRVGRLTPEQEGWLPHIYRGAGIDRRYFCLDRSVVDDALHGTNQSASPFLPQPSDAANRGPTTAARMAVYRTAAPVLAAQAAAAALRNARTPASRITHLVTVSCTGFHAPGFDLALIRDLHLPPGTPRTHLGYMGCHGALNGLRVARAFCAAEPDARVLLCAVELCSLHYHYGFDPQKLIANALFADGAAAAIIGPSSTAGWRAAASGAFLIPDSGDAMSWLVGDHGFEMTLAKQVPRLINQHLRPWISEWLAGMSLNLDSVMSWAIHPGGPRILDAAAEALGLSAAALQPSRDVFAEFGNMSSPTVLFILERLRGMDAARPCVALGFGPGLCVEAALLT